MVKRVFVFYRHKKDKWYLELPEWEGDPEDLQMIEGADQWLDLLGENRDRIEVAIANAKFEGADFLTLMRISEPNLGGGGNYFLESYQGNKVELKVWLCEVAEFVFGEYPQRIYFAVL